MADDGAVLEGFEISPGGLRCTIHAENSPILFWRQNRLKAAGRDDPLAHLAARTDVVALEALNRAAMLAEWTGARIHIVHESSADSAALHPLPQGARRRHDGGDPAAIPLSLAPR